MKCIAPLFEHHIHNGAAIVAKLRRETVVLDLKLLNDLHGRLVINVGVASFALLRCADGTAIEGDLSRGVALAVGNTIGSRGIAKVGAGGSRYSARQEHQAEHVSVVEWDVTYIFIGDIRPKSG